MEKIAVFDLDGTCFNGNAGMNFGKKLIVNQLIDKTAAIEIYKLYKSYSSGQVEKSLIVDQIYKLFASGMKDKNVDQVQLTAESAWRDMRGNLFEYAKPLIKTLGRYGYHTVLMTGSPTEIASQAAKDLGIKNVIAGQLETINGAYTGKTILSISSSEDKARALDTHIKSNNIDVDWKHSLGFGNDERDEDILKRVGLPFAFEPNDYLARIAKENNWRIVNRDDDLTVVL